MYSDSMCGPQLVPPTEKAATYVTIIKIIMFFQLIVALLDIVAGRSFIREGIFGIFFELLLFAAFYKLSYESILIYTFASIFFTVVFLVYILTIIQRGAKIADLQSPWSRYYLAVACISFAFYLFNSIFFFYPYRQFKMIEYFENPVFSEMMMQSGQRNPQQMGQVVNQPIDYGNNEPSRQIKSKGTFQVFKGQGVRIG